MGDDADPAARQAPSHDVELGGFGIAAGCVTAAEYFEFIKGAGDGFDESWCDYIDPCFIIRVGTGFELRPGTDDFPMVQLDFWGCAAYCNWLSVTEGLTPVYDLAAGTGDIGRDGYRLPTEAEWEYACVTGLAEDGPVPGTVNHLGAELAEGLRRAGEDRKGGFCVPEWTPGPVEVTAVPPDRNGLHAMLGNVREWCHDIYSHYDAAPKRHPTGGGRGHYRVVRGGSFLDGHEMCGPRVRAASHERNKCMQYGFRVARSLI
ncbi:formylglycine-generating enzyme family protein [Streptomyces sp. 8N706]|uniref:formylglycine-generating enzyme family protein n=1 Tax=Streptomyces sp. 8N706 TaxID=3457416 RepID=UPI003FD2C7A9